MDNRHLTIRITAVIEKPSQIPLDTPVDVTSIVEGKNVDIVLVQLGLNLNFGEMGSDILDDAGATLEVLPCKAACAVNRGRLEDHQRMIFWACVCIESLSENTGYDQSYVELRGVRASPSHDRQSHGHAMHGV